MVLADTPDAVLVTHFSTNTTHLVPADSASPFKTNIAQYTNPKKNPLPDTALITFDHALDLATSAYNGTGQASDASEWADQTFRQQMEFALRVMHDASLSPDIAAVCRRMHHNDKICMKIIAGQFGIGTRLVAAAVWQPVRPPSGGRRLYDSLASSREPGCESWIELDLKTQQQYDAEASAIMAGHNSHVKQWEKELDSWHQQAKDASDAVDAVPDTGQRRRVKRGRGGAADDHAGVLEAVAVLPVARKKSNQDSDGTTVVKEKRAPTAHMEAIRANNGRIKLDRQASVKNSSVFFNHYSELLEPFGATLPSLGNNKNLKLVPTRTVMQPPQLQAELRPHQMEGLSWLVNMYESGVSAILGDEMGLGKTIQTIAFMAHLKFQRGISGPFLIVAPLTVLSSWVHELRRFCPTLAVVKMHSSEEKEREDLKNRVMRSVTEIDVVVTTYETIRSQTMQILFRSVWWRYVVLDEAHVIKNELSQKAKAARSLHFQAALLLTGTPLQNNLHEVWSLLNFLYPTVFKDSSKFDQGFDLSTKEVDSDLLEKTHYMLRPFMLRRLKSEVEKKLPPKLETKIMCHLSEMQKFWYMRLLLKDSNTLTQFEQQSVANAQLAAVASAGSSTWKRLQSLLMQLRKCCNHPYLFPDADPNPGCIDEELVDSCGKLQILDHLLRKLHKKGHRVVLFSQMSQMLNILEDFLRLREYQYCRLDGSSNRVQRSVEINSFNANGSKIFVFLMTTRSGGLGINLQTADTVILYDSDWNPQPDLQAMARVHRIGQSKVVHVYRMVTRGTIEEKILDRAEQKLYLDQMVNSKRASEQEGATGEDEAETPQEMMEALRFGAQAIAGLDSTEPPTDAELDAIIDRTRNGNDSIGRLVGGTEFKAADFTAQGSLGSIRELQGEIYGAKEVAKKQTESIDINQEWTLQRARKKKSRVETIRVDGVGQVNILKEDMGGTAPEDEKALRSFQSLSTHQKAGRDYEHSQLCLSCWDGGDLVLCDHCPSAYHLGCLNIKQEDTKGIWSCPHHSCSVCFRKAGAAGGLLFRCQMCPKAYCEDHLPVGADIVKTCKRFEALGYNQPRSGCYIFCGSACVAFAKKSGFATDEAFQASGSGLLGSTGVDLTDLGAGGIDRRSDWEKLPETTRKGLEQSLAQQPSYLGAQAPKFTDACLSAKVNSDLHSTLDMLHDVLFDTMLYTQRERSDFNEVFSRIASWKGVSEYHPFEYARPELCTLDFQGSLKDLEEKLMKNPGEFVTLF